MDVWSKLTEKLDKDEEETISFFNVCTETEIYWLSEVFEDISNTFKSPDFIVFLKQLQKKYIALALDLESDIKYAKDAIK